MAQPDKGRSGGSKGVSSAPKRELTFEEKDQELFDAYGKVADVLISENAKHLDTIPINAKALYTYSDAIEPLKERFGMTPEDAYRLTGVSDLGFDAMSIRLRDGNIIVQGSGPGDRSTTITLQGAGAMKSIYFDGFFPYIDQRKPNKKEGGLASIMGSRLLAAAEKHGIRFVTLTAGGEGRRNPGGANFLNNEMTGYKQWLGMGATFTSRREWDTAISNAISRAEQHGVQIPTQQDVFGKVMKKREISPDKVRDALRGAPKPITEHYVAQHPVLYAMWSQYGVGGSMAIDLRDPAVKAIGRRAAAVSLARRANLKIGGINPSDLGPETNHENW